MHERDEEYNWWRGWCKPLYRALGWATVAALVLLAAARAVGADPSLAKHAVVKVNIPLGNGRFSGGSATVVLTEPGRTILTSAEHMFHGADRHRKFNIEAPAPTSGPSINGNLRCIDVDPANDLALLQMDIGPLPYVCPVAPAGAAYEKHCLSVGYDDAKTPPTMRPATIVSQEGGRTLTRERPWHGRSGGAIIDERNGWLVGVVSGYSGPRSRQEVVGGANGIYASHQAVVALLRKNGIEPGGSASPQSDRFAPGLPMQQPFPQRQQRAPLPGGT